MGVAPSKLEDNKVLVLCQERKRLVREALDGRCALAASHYAYILSLREIGSLLRKCFEESITNVSPSLLYVNHMSAGRNSVKTTEEVSVPAQSSFPGAREGSQDIENADGVRHLQEEEVIPELKEGENTPTNGYGGFAESEDDFDNPSTETLVQVFKNQNDVLVASTDSHSRHALENIASQSTDSRNRNSKNKMTMTGRSSLDVLPVDVELKKPYTDVGNVVRDINSCMKKVEILFFRACDSGKEVPFILEEDKVQFRLLLPEEIAHGSKPSSFLAALFACRSEDTTVPEFPPQADIKYLTWHRSVSSQLSPSRNSLGINAGSHISTLDRLYAWESKLYDEVKASSANCRKYDEKCKKLRHLEARGGNQIDIDFTRAAVKDLHSRVLVSVQKIDFISKSIEDMRDEDLQPQLDELVGCFTRMWATMLECHQSHCGIIKFAFRSCSLKISFQSESQCQAALLLLVELRKLCSNFQNWIASHKAYLCSLNLWLHKCMKPLKRRKVSRKRNAVDVSLTGSAVAPIFTTCEMWIKLLDDLPTRDLEEAIEGLIADTCRSIPRQGKVPNDGKGGDVQTSHAPADLQSSLLRFLEKLEAFSEISVQRYVDLRKNVSAAKERIWRKDSNSAANTNYLILV
ncbi:hypothetical protein SEVIR_2G452000v4 [Setaria viridis]|uniref:DUF632 domain-containing protein n=1 Tax=Setaria viridis TaxID=4556 RepID=A0A4U6W2Q6_SETVI|nr:protein ALTERED PHOSPHATE STARVATION RESPONSE 1-like isoform X1 [Setaria viridis]TKW36621.1 hypothetical protein SEVIR_2G452000v2 [Setaria viridis]